MSNVSSPQQENTNVIQSREELINDDIKTSETLAQICEIYADKALDLQIAFTQLKNQAKARVKNLQVQLQQDGKANLSQLSQIPASEVQQSQSRRSKL